MNDNFSLLRDILGYLALVIGAILILKSKIKTDNLKDLKLRVEILEKEREEAREQHVDNQKAISNLEGQLKTYKEIPLKAIASSLDKLSESNGNILRVLEGSTIIAAKDRDVLLNSNQHIDTQHVDTQVIKKEG